jgi:hypothetical protein
MTTIRIYTVGLYDDSFSKMTRFVTIGWEHKSSDLKNGFYTDCIPANERTRGLRKVGAISKGNQTHEQIMQEIRFKAIR